MAPTTVAILGTGKMGGAMARRLHQQGFELRLWNRTRQRAEQLGFGAVLNTPAEAAGEADFVISMLTDAAAVRQAYLGPDGALEAKGSPTYIDSSTVDPKPHEDLARAAAQRGSIFVEAPVLGSIPAVEAGKLFIMVGGEPDAFERIRPVLQVLGDVRYIGPLGAAALLKLVANSMLAIINAGASELYNAGVRAGLDRERVWEVLTRLAPSLEARRAGFMDGRYEPVLFRLADMVKDLGLATGLYRDIGIDTPLTQTAKELFQRAAQDHSEQDLAAIADLWRGPIGAPPAGRR
jgi:3-hydroxyisobutyrate dehydrogenase-like beta-hydroxyacid dehydrogenase